MLALTGPRPTTIPRLRLGKDSLGDAVNAKDLMGIVCGLGVGASTGQLLMTGYWERSVAVSAGGEPHTAASPRTAASRPPSSMYYVPQSHPPATVRLLHPSRHLAVRCAAPPTHHTLPHPAPRMVVFMRFQRRQQHTVHKPAAAVKCERRRRSPRTRQTCKTSPCSAPTRSLLRQPRQC